MKQIFTVYTRDSLKQEKGRFIDPVIAKGRFYTEEQAAPLADSLRKSGKFAEIGKFYLFTREEWNRNQYKDTLKDEDGTPRRSTIINGDHGTTLIFEGLHFEIIGKEDKRA